MVKLLTLVVALVGGIGFIFYQAAKFAFQINNPAGMAKRDGNKLRALLGPYLDKLVPLTAGEMELFALNKETRRIKKGRHIITTGVYNSIYHEPLMAFAYKEYKGKNVATLMAKTRDLEYFYISINGETRVFLNGKAFGVITNTGVLYTPDRSKKLASISPEDILELHPIKIGEKGDWSRSES